MKSGGNSSRLVNLTHIRPNPAIKHASAFPFNLLMWGRCWIYPSFQALGHPCKSRQLAIFHHATKKCNVLDLKYPRGDLVRSPFQTAKPIWNDNNEIKKTWGLTKIILKKKKGRININFCWAPILQYSFFRYAKKAIPSLTSSLNVSLIFLSSTGIRD